MDLGCLNRLARMVAVLAVMMAAAGEVRAEGGLTIRSVLSGKLSPVTENTTVRSGYSIPRNHGPSFRDDVVFETNERPGTVIVDTQTKNLYYVTAANRALRYRIGVGRDGFGWTGIVNVGRKAEWPGWRPPAEMRKRDPSLPEYVPPGPFNPLGALSLIHI